MLPLYAILIFDFGIIPTVWYFVFQILQLFRQCGIFFSRFYNYSDNVVLFSLDFAIIPTVWYFFSKFWIYSDSVVFFSLAFGIIPTVWYFFLQILELLRQCGIFFSRFWIYSDSVVFFSLDFGIIPTVWYFFLQILEFFRQSGIFVFHFITTNKTQISNIMHTKRFQTLHQIRSKPSSCTFKAQIRESQII